MEFIVYSVLMFIDLNKRPSLSLFVHELSEGLFSILMKLLLIERKLHPVTLDLSVSKLIALNTLNKQLTSINYRPIFG